MMRLATNTLPLFVAAFLLAAGCDPDTTPIPKGDAGSQQDAAAGSGGSGGSGGTAGIGGTAGTGGEAGSSSDAGGATGDSGEEGGDDAGDAAGSGGSAGSGTGYSHTISIDGMNDFDVGKEKFTTSSIATDVYQGFVSWDANFVFLGMDGKSIADKSSGDWVVAYIGGTPGSKSGLPYGSMSPPSLPFDGLYHLRWKADGTYTNGQKWDSGQGAWVDANWTKQAASSGTYVEIAISRLDIGFPSKVQIVFSMLRETVGSEWVWAGVPSAGLVDGKTNVAYTKYFEFDFNSSSAPSSYFPLP